VVWAGRGQCSAGLRIKATPARLGLLMLRLTAIFIAVCVVLIAASLGAVVYLMLGLSVAESAIVALAALATLTIYNTVSSRVRDRSDVGDQIADLSRGTADLARQVGELGRKVAAFENDAGNLERRVKVVVDPVRSEIGELGTLIKNLAETVAAHEGRIAALASSPPSPATEIASAAAPAAVLVALPADTPAPVEAKSEPVSAGEESGPFKGKSSEEIVAIIREAVDANRIDLYLQPILTLPQRKVRYYESMTRLRTADGTLVLPADFLKHAENAGLMPKIDNLMLFRCVQVLRRLLLKNREIGLFCNIAMSTLNDPEFYPQFSQFMEANRALAPSLMLELPQESWRAMGPMETESLSAFAERGFRFSMDQVTDLRMEPRDLSERGIRFVKVQAGLLLNKAAAPSDIHAGDLSDLLGRFGISLVAERIETEAVVVDLLDYDVRFGQGFLFSPPRPVRAEALQGVADRDVVIRDAATNGAARPSAPEIPAAAPVRAVI
jgi:cyclic-di-GMP phosphodiesterase TipF (flagellum assembly factor)